MSSYLLQQYLSPKANCKPPLFRPNLTDPPEKINSVTDKNSLGKILGCLFAPWSVCVRSQLLLLKPVRCVCALLLPIKTLPYQVYTLLNLLACSRWQSWLKSYFFQRKNQLLAQSSLYTQSAPCFVFSANLTRFAPLFNFLYPPYKYKKGRFIFVQS